MHGTRQLHDIVKDLADNVVCCNKFKHYNVIPLTLFVVILFLSVGDGLYMDMKPAVDSKSPPSSYDYVKVADQGQEDKGAADVVHTSEENPYVF